MRPCPFVAGVSLESGEGSRVKSPQKPQPPSVYLSAQPVHHCAPPSHGSQATATLPFAFPVTWRTKGKSQLKVSGTFHFHRKGFVCLHLGTQRKTEGREALPHLPSGPGPVCSQPVTRWRHLLAPSPDTQSSMPGTHVVGES